MKVDKFNDFSDNSYCGTLRRVESHLDWRLSMNNIFTGIMLTTLLVMVGLLPACSAVGLGGTTTMQKDFTNFTSVDVEDTFEVEIAQSNSFSTTVVIAKDLRDYVDVSKEGKH